MNIFYKRYDKLPKSQFGITEKIVIFSTDNAGRKQICRCDASLSRQERIDFVRKRLDELGVDSSRIVLLKRTDKK